MLFFMGQTERLYKQITATESAEVLLHGDLHHENILYCENGSWKVIDPKGVIGIPCLETGRFIQNHLARVDAAQQQPALDEMAALFGVAFQWPKRTIATCAFIDCVLSRCWTLEGHLSPSEFVAAQTEAIERSAFYFNFINTLSPNN